MARKKTNPELKIYFKSDFYTLIDKNQEKAYKLFMDDDKFKKIWANNSEVLDNAVINLYFDLFHEKVKKTSCISCINNRLFRIRKFMRRHVGW